MYVFIDSCIKRYTLQIVHVKNLTCCKSNTLSILHVIKATRIKSYMYENIHVWNGEFWLVLKHTRMKSFTLLLICVSFVHETFDTRVILYMKLLIRVSFYTWNFWYACVTNVKLCIRRTFAAFCPFWPTIGSSPRCFACLTKWGRGTSLVAVLLVCRAASHKRDKQKHREGCATANKLLIPHWFHKESDYWYMYNGHASSAEDIIQVRWRAFTKLLEERSSGHIQIINILQVD